MRRFNRFRVPTVIGNRIDIACPGFEDIELLLGTKTGLYFLVEGELYQLFAGRVYGITKKNSRWYFILNQKLGLGSKKLASVGVLVSFRFFDKWPSDIRVESHDLGTSIHQIDSWNSRLYITDTQSNCIVRFEIENDKLKNKEKFYPFGKVQNGRSSKNYVHLNSIVRNDSNIYVVCHNDSQKTGKHSSLAKLSMDLEFEEEICIPAKCAHNLIFDGSNKVYCDSAGGRLMNEFKVLFSHPTFLRGLARSNEHWFLGGSDFSTKSERSQTTGYLFKLNSEGQQLANCTFPQMGSIYEVRLVAENDAGLSQTAL